jgi:TolB-like protein/DNA-binding winged helix-turn-helix (wHTH) protein
MNYAIGSYAIDVARREVRRSDAVVSVEPKVFDLLLHLVKNSCRVVSKDELIERIWHGRAISDAALSSCIKAARRAIGDDGRQQQLIRTIHRCGFRFVGPVLADEQKPMTIPAPAPAASPCAIVELGGSPLAMDAACDLDLALPILPSIAILPIKALGDTAQSGLIADGFTHDLTGRLSRSRSLFVTARASAARFTASSLDPAAIGERLGVRYLVDGSLVLVDRRLRLTIALTDTRRNCEIWAEHFDCTLDDIFAVQDEIGDYVAAVVGSEVERTECQRAMQVPFSSLDAWSAYHRARHHLYRYTAEDCDRAEHYFGIAAELAPHASRVFAGLSFIHWQRAFLDIVSDRQDAIAKAFDHARHSVALDPLDPQGHWALGRAFLLTEDIDASAGDLQDAVDLNPNFAIGQYSLAYLLGFGSDSASGFALLTKARRLSPYDPMTYAFLALRATLHGVHGEPEEAAAWARRAVRQPNAHYHVHAISGWCHQLAGEHEEARKCIARLREVRPGYSRADYFRVFPFCPDKRAVIDRALAELGV